MILNGAIVGAILPGVPTSRIMDAVLSNVVAIVQFGNNSKQYRTDNITGTAGPLSPLEGLQNGL